MAVPPGMVIVSSPSRVPKGNSGAERGLRHRHVQLVDEVVAVALEAVVGLHPQVDVEVAGGAAARADRAAPGEAQRGARVDAGGDVDV